MLRIFKIPREFFPSTDETRSAGYSDQRQTLAQLLDQVTTIVRRNQKGLAQSQDQYSHVMAMTDLEHLLLSGTTGLQSISVDSEPRHSVIQPIAGKTWLNPDELVESDLTKNGEFAKFAASCASDDCGLVEVLDVHCLRQHKDAISFDATQVTSTSEHAPSRRLVEYVTGNSDKRSNREQETGLTQTLEKIVASQDSFMVQSQGHEKLTRALAGLICVKRGMPPSELRLRYRDGSVPASFPTYSVTPKDPALWKNAVRFAFALISIRHAELDYVVDLSLIHI